MTLVWQEVSHPEYLTHKGTQVRSYDFSERRDDGGLVGLVISFESGTKNAVRREVEELAGSTSAITYMTLIDVVAEEAQNPLKINLTGSAFFVLLEEEVELSGSAKGNLVLSGGRPTGRCRIILSKTPRLKGDLPSRPRMQKQPSLEDFQE